MEKKVSKFSHLRTVRAKGASPPPLLVSPTVKYPFIYDFSKDIANQTIILTWDFAHLRQVYGHDLLFSLQKLLNFCPTTSFLMSKINVRTMKGFPPAQDYCRSVFFVDDR